ncbi:MAG: TonB-dependent receptor [Acidobacteriota bacterium]
MRRSPLALFGCVALALVLACGLAVPVLAQTDVTTSRISGTVTDESKTPLPGVTVEAKNKDTGLTATVVTDSSGAYRLLNLPTGTYALQASLEGFATGAADNVRLVLGSVPTVNFTLPQAKVQETITVTAEQRPIIEVTNTTSSTTILTEQVKQLPIGGRDYKNLVLLTPETRLDSERGNISISGQRGINTNVTVDGVDYNDPFFGGTVGSAENRAPLSLSEESIKEFTVITNGASVEFGRSGGGFVNVITKSGTNNWHGSAFYYNQPQKYIADFADGRKPQDQKKDEYGASFGGPILRDKLFFFASYDKQKQDVTIPIQPSVIDPLMFARYPAFASPDRYVQTRDGDVGFGRLDYQATDSQRFMLRFNRAKYDGQNGTSSSQAQSASHNGNEGMLSKSYVGQWSGQFGSNWLNDLNLNKVDEDTPRQDKGLGLPEIQVTGRSYGEVSFLPIISTTKRKEVSDTVSYMVGAHVFKAGADYNDTGVDQVFKGNWRGVYIFNTEADLLAGKWSQFRQFGGLNGLTADQAGRANFGQKEKAAFLQDQWYLKSNVTLSLGLRWEGLDNPNDPVLNPNDRNANGSFNLTGHIPDANKQWSPRLGVTWSPTPKSVLRFTAGRFWSRTPALLWAQLLTSNGVRATQFITSSPSDPLAPGWGANFNPNVVAPVDFAHVAAAPRPGVFAISPNFDNPYTDRVTLGSDLEVYPGTSLGLDATYAKGHQLERLSDINLQYDGTISANGMPHYRKSPNPYYGKITYLMSDATSKYWGVTASLNHRLRNHFAYFATATYSIDKDSDSNERNFSGIQAEDVNNLDLNYGYSNRDQRWKLAMSGLWETPWWGLVASGSFRFATGSPYTASTGTDTNGDGNFTDRPTVNGVHFARNSFRQPNFASFDVRVGKQFHLGPGDLGLYGECFNCLNVANHFVPTSNMTWGTGQTPNASFGKATGVTTTPRTIQFSLRYDF